MVIFGKRIDKSLRQKADWFPSDAWPMWLAAFAFYHKRTFGLWFLLGLIIETAPRLTGVLGRAEGE